MFIEFSRQPRFIPEVPVGEIEIEAPGGMSEKPEISWFSLLVTPCVMLVVTILAAMSSFSLFMIGSIVMTIMTLIGSLAGAAHQIRKHKKRKKEREKRYLQLLADTKGELILAQDKQAKAMLEMNPEPSECISRILKVDSKLWERTKSAPDFLSIRVGIGNIPMKLRLVNIQSAGFMENDPLVAEPQKLSLQFDKVPNVPVCLNLIDSEICGIVGDNGKIQEFIKSMLLQIITHHGYDDVRIVALVSEDSLEYWDFIRFLPHNWNDDLTLRYLLCGKTMAQQTLAELYSIIKERDSKEQNTNFDHHYIFIVEDADLLENEQINKYLYNCSSKLGVCTIFTSQQSAYLPMNCKTVVTLQDKTAEIANRINGEKMQFMIDKPAFKNIEIAARKLSAIRIKQTSKNFVLPKSITLMEMLNEKDVLNVDILSRWRNNKTYNGMAVPIGCRVGNNLFSLDIHESGHGPHGLVAGTTGSGKSELLQSIIISIAINYHPHDVVFVLIDYKGGGMADAFKGMPHLVGTITNLGGNQTTRALLSIKSELMRRQKVFSEYGVNNIDKYQKLFYNKNDKDMPVIPHLVMIADEFAELKQDQPDFMKELVSAARVGRSLGVHLILATQKPAGVVDDQIWSNSKFKLCLKVQDETDSNDVLKRPDAAFIKEAGRAYIQVGNNEIFDLFQSAYSGAGYDPKDDALLNSNKARRVFSVALNGRAERIYPISEERIEKDDMFSQLDAMAGHIINVAKENSISQLDGPWLPPLPEDIYLNDIFKDKMKLSSKPSDLLYALVGLVDDPRGQKQEWLKLNFAEDGNLFIYGAPGTGKTFLLKTICLSLAHLYSPQEVNIYILDFGGTSLKVFNKLPHCGGVLTLEQDAMINQFMLFLFRLIDDRKKLFENSGYESFADYRASGNKLPAVIVMTDNHFALSETYEAVDEQMLLLVREGFKYGLFFIATVTNSALVRYRFSINFKMVISLQLIDNTEYSGIVGRTEGLEPGNFPGRGLVRDKNPLEFQTAMPEYRSVKKDDTDFRNELIYTSTKEIIEMFSEKETSRATAIPVMPDKIDIKNLNGSGIAVESFGIGLADHDLQAININLTSISALLVTGEPMSGKSSLVSSWIKLLADTDVYAIDSSSMGLYQILKLENVTDITNSEDEFVEEFEEVLNDRKQKIIDCKTSGGSLEELLKSWKQIIFVIDRLSEFTEGYNDNLMEMLDKIIKKERGMKILVIAIDNCAEAYGNYDDLGKTIKAEQTGVLLGSIKEQDIFTARVPYGVPEKELQFGDGYYIVKNKYAGLRLAFCRNEM